jgi:glycosyltransferase involved in cell wall biosynthesis
VKTIDPDSSKCITVNNGIDQSAFSPSIAQAIHRSDLGLQPNDFVLVFSGRMNEEKGIAELVQAMKLLHETPDIKLLVMGSSFFGDSSADSPFIRQLKAEASQLRDRIVFTGFIPYSQVPNYLQLADVAVIPSMWDDPFPTSVLEAMCMGMPIITTCRGGIPEEVTPENAIILPTDKDIVERMRTAILDLHDNSEKRMLMGQESKRLSTRFNRDRFAEDFFNALSF